MHGERGEALKVALLKKLKQLAPEEFPSPVPESHHNSKNNNSNTGIGRLLKRVPAVGTNSSMVLADAAVEIGGHVNYSNDLSNGESNDNISNGGSGSGMLRTHLGSLDYSPDPSSSNNDVLHAFRGITLPAEMSPMNQLQSTEAPIAGNKKVKHAGEVGGGVVDVYVDGADDGEDDPVDTNESILIDLSDVSSVDSVTSTGTNTGSVDKKGNEQGMQVGDSRSSSTYSSPPPRAPVRSVQVQLHDSERQEQAVCEGVGQGIYGQDERQAESDTGVAVCAVVDRGSANVQGSITSASSSVVGASAAAGAADVSPMFDHSGTFRDISSPDFSSNNAGRNGKSISGNNSRRQTWEAVAKLYEDEDSDQSEYAI